MLAAGVLDGTSALRLFADEKKQPVLKIGLMTDVHYADKEPGINRFYRESPAKVREAVEKFNAMRADFVVELGDLIDTAESVTAEAAAVRKMKAELARFKGDCFYVLGNHCVSALSKEEFLQNFGAGRKETYYSFDRGQFHFIVLDACFRADGQPYEHGNFKWTDSDIPEVEREWLRKDLGTTTRPTIVFIHQRLDWDGNPHTAKSAPAVRAILEKSHRVLAVFQGHSHKNDYKDINGIHYCTLRAMVEGSGEENNSYGVLNLSNDGSMRLAGFRQQKEWQSPPVPGKAKGSAESQA